MHLNAFWQMEDLQGTAKNIQKELGELEFSNI
jgi:hypothetical protein